MLPPTAEVLQAAKARTGLGFRFRDSVSEASGSVQEATVLPPTAEVLQAAKARTLNSFVFNFSSTEAQLQRLIGFTLLGLPQVTSC